MCSGNWEKHPISKAALEKPISCPKNQYHKTFPFSFLPQTSKLMRAPGQRRNAKPEPIHWTTALDALYND